MVTDIAVTWGRPTWTSLFRYQRGDFLNVTGVDQIWRHVGTGQVRIYSGDNWDGMRVSFNGGDPVTMRARGRFGRLYISEAA